MRIATRFLATSILGATFFLSNPGFATDMVFAGFDLFVTKPGTQYDFGGFAGLGLVGFTGVPIGVFDFGGGPENVGDVDTIVRRLGTATIPFPTIPIEIVELQLVSSAPIDIGNGPEDLFITLNNSLIGSMTITGLGSEGAPHGTFDSGLQFIFDVSGSTSGFLGSINTTITQSGSAWRHAPVAGLPVILGVNRFLNTVDDSNDFWPGSVTEAHPGVGVHVAGASPAPIPTVSEWGMIVMALLGTALATVAIRRHSLVPAGASVRGGASLVRGGGSLFMPERYAQTLIVVLLLLVAGMTALALAGTEIATRDVIGSLLAAGIAAYVLHLWTAPSENAQAGD